MILCSLATLLNVTYVPSRSVFPFLLCSILSSPSSNHIDICDTCNIQFIHPWVIDTALIYQHPRGPPFKPSLKWLAQKWLQKEIQTPHPVVDGEAIGGHDSEEDAR